MTAITPEQFMTQNEPEEDDLETYTLLGIDPLVTIAESLRSIEARLTTDYDDGLVRELSQELADLEAKHAELYALLEEIEAIIKPSTSKLANSVRDAITAWRAPEAPAAPTPEADQPAHDADVEQWREFARASGVLPDEPDAIDSMNRSQIRTLLGIDQPTEVAS